MSAPTFDPGITQHFGGRLRRVLNRDGSFNVRRSGTTWRDVHPYLYLINASWMRFLLTLFAGYLLMNIIFGSVYYALGPGHLQGGDGNSDLERFMNAFFFSAHTLTTVGYGNISPKGVAANSIAVVEAMAGLLGFAFATGLFFGRVSKPSARIGFSENLLVAPYQDGWSLQFRVVNKRANTLMNLEATVMMMTVETGPTGPRAKYNLLSLERQSIIFFPLTWTVVHPIDSASPLAGLNADDLERAQAEFLILIKGFDDTFSQTVHVRFSYRHDEIVWNTKFQPAFVVDDQGDVVLQVNKVGALV
jgi:inward rectifier potassium channel